MPCPQQSRRDVGFATKWCSTDCAKEKLWKLHWSAELKRSLHKCSSSHSLPHGLLISRPRVNSALANAPMGVNSPRSLGRLGVSRRSFTPVVHQPTRTTANIHECSQRQIRDFAGISEQLRNITKVWIRLHTAEVRGSNPLDGSTLKCVDLQVNHE